MEGAAPAGAAAAHLALGQFEPARALLRGAAAAAAEEGGSASVAAAGGVRGLRRLADWAAGAPPPPGWLASPAVPSAEHLAWLCLCEHRLLAPEEQQLPQAAAEETELRLLARLVERAGGGGGGGGGSLRRAQLERVGALLLAEWGVGGAAPGRGEAHWPLLRVRAAP